MDASGNWAFHTQNDGDDDNSDGNGDNDGDDDGSDDGSDDSHKCESVCAEKCGQCLDGCIANQCDENPFNYCFIMQECSTECYMQRRGHGCKW